MVVDPGPQESVFLACPGQHGDEAPAVPGDMARHVAIGEVGVSDVAKVTPCLSG